MKRKIHLYRPRLLLMAICLSLLSVATFGQSGSGGNPKEPKLQISISKSGEISLSAVEVNTNALSAELSRKLKIPVILSSLMRDKIANVAFYNLPLEEAARQLAPHARIDYVLTQKNKSAPLERPLAIYLSGYNEPEPDTVQGAEAATQTVVLEGDTETIDEARKEENLKINFADNRLTLRARRQNLSFVVSEIAARANLMFDSRYETDKLIDAEISNQPLAEALLSLSPHARIYLRKDLLTGQTTPFRVSLSKQD